MNAPKALLFLLLIFYTSPLALVSSDISLSHVGLISFDNSDLADQFARRLAARGKPLFIVSDIGKGISQGDMIRFADKAVLIDADIWQTMMSMGILNKLKNIPIMTLTAKARSQVWEARSDLVSKSNENKGYTLGRELLKIFEDYFGNTPSSMELVIKFDNGYMSLVAPSQLLNELNFVNVVRMTSKPTAKPFFITVQPPRPQHFIDQPFQWTLWALDPSDPTGQLSYSCTSELPQGLSFDIAKHTLSGVPTVTGSWPLSFSVRNSKSATAFLACTLNITGNTAPRVNARYDDVLISGTNWTYLPFIADAEHTLNDLHISISGNPPSMSCDTSSGLLQWIIPSSIQDTTLLVTVQAKDPLDLSGKDTLKLHVLSSQLANRSLTIDFKLPLDTMIQGHHYRWANESWIDAQWKDRAVKLMNIEGDDSTRYVPFKSGNEGELFITPRKPGIHGITVRFLADTLSIDVKKSIFVKPNRAPLFKSTMMQHVFCDSQRVYYKPIVFDDDGDSVTIMTTGKDGITTPLSRKGLRLATDSSGLYTFMLTARDPFDNIARQQIYYTVKTAPAPVFSSMDFYIQSTTRNSVDVGFQSSGMRFGLYSTDIWKTLSSGFLGINTYETPFLFFGASPLGQKQTSYGNFLYVDGGISFRMYNERLFGGGMMARVQGNYRKKGISAWKFQTYCAFRLKQALLIADTAGLAEELRQTVDGPEDIFDPKIGKYVENLMDLFGAYGKSDNFGLHLQFQTLYKLPANFWCGPTAWIEDDIKPSVPPQNFQKPSISEEKPFKNGNILVQYSGICLQHEWQFKWLNYSQQLSTGWKGNSFSPKIQWNFTAKFSRRQLQ